MRELIFHKLSKYIIAFVLIYISIQIPPYFLPVGVPDEGLYFTKFLNGSELISESGILSYIFQETNQLGLGAIYWIVGSCISYLTHNNIHLVFGICRIITFLSLISVPLTIMYIFEKNMQANLKNRMSILAFLVISLWVSQGMAWWYGKLIGPDISTMAMSFIASFLILGNIDINPGSTAEVNFDISTRLVSVKNFSIAKVLSIGIGSAFLGLSVGIRLTVLPVLFFLFVLLFLNILNIQNPFNKLIIIFFGILIGFIAANPFLLINNVNNSLNIFRENISSVNTVEDQFNFGKIKYVLSNSSWTWDAIPLGGFSQVSINLISVLIIFCVLVIFYRKSVFISLFISLIFTLSLFSKASVFYSWYLFPASNLIFISLCSYCFGLQKLFRFKNKSIDSSSSHERNPGACNVNLLETGDEQQRKIFKFLYMLIALALGLNIVFNFSFISKSYSNKFLHYQALSSLKSGETQDCVFNSISNNSNRLNDFDLIVNIAEIGLFDFPVGKSYYLERYKAWRFINSSQFTSKKLLEIDHEIKNVVIVLGKRLIPKSESNELSFSSILLSNQSFVSRFPSTSYDYDFGQCPHAEYLYLSKRR